MAVITTSSPGASRGRTKLCATRLIASVVPRTKTISWRSAAPRNPAHPAWGPPRFPSRSPRGAPGYEPSSCGQAGAHQAVQPLPDLGHVDPRDDVRGETVGHELPRGVRPHAPGLQVE